MKKGILVIFLIIVFIIFVLIFFNKGEYNSMKNGDMNNSNFITSNNNTVTNNVNNNNSDYNIYEVEEQSVENVKMEIKEGTLNKTGATIIIKDSNIKPFVYSEWFRIDKKVNDSWEKLNIINDKHSFSAIAYNIDNTGKLERAIDWSDIYGNLDKGSYKLIKNVYDNEGNEIYFSVEFDIVEQCKKM